MPKLIEAGTICGRLTVTRVLPVKTGMRRRAECKCLCGTSVTRRVDALQQEGMASCGCYVKEQAAAEAIKRNKAAATHKMTGTKTHRCWHSMVQRCCHKSQKAYADYGAKGTVICAWLRESPQNLLDLLGPPTPELPSLDRFPIHDGNYTCGKCEQCLEKGWELNLRWATRKQQAENRGAFNVFLVAFGKRLIRSHWQELSGISSETVRSRLERQEWSLERALTTPDKAGNCYKPTAEEWEMYPDGSGYIETRSSSE